MRPLFSVLRCRALFARCAVACFILLLGDSTQPARSAAASPEKLSPPVLDLTVAKTGWGEGNGADVDAVLRSAGRELLVNFPGERIEPIDVSRSAEGPITLFKRSPEKKIVVLLNTGDLYWAQYAFQFGHELCHVLCNYCEADKANQWVEESICELSSLYVLRRMGERWKTDPPYESWKDFAPHLTEYAQQRIGDSELPRDTTLAQWFAKNRDALCKSEGSDRSRNTIVAAALLPLIEAHPEQWPAVRHLNDARPKEVQTLEAFLQRWHDHTPVEHQTLVRKFAEELGLRIEVTSSGSSSSARPEPAACK